MPKNKNKLTLKQRLKCKRLQNHFVIDKSIKTDLTDFYIKVYEKMKDMNYFKEPYKICNGAFNPDLSDRTVSKKTGLPLMTMQDYTDYLSQFIVTPYNILTLNQLMICVLMYVHMRETTDALETAILNFIEENKEKDARVKEIAEKYEDFDVRGQLNDQSINLEAENAFLTYLCITYHMKNAMFETIKDTHNLIHNTKDEDPITTKSDPLYELIDNIYINEWIKTKDYVAKMYDHVTKVFKVNEKFNRFFALIKVKYYAFIGEATNIFNSIFGKKEINYFDYYKEQMFGNNNLSNMKYFRNLFSETASNLSRANGVLISLEEMADVLYMFAKDKEVPKDLYDKYFGANYNKSLTNLITLYENCSELFGLSYDTIQNLCLEYKIRSKLINN